MSTSSRRQPGDALIDRYLAGATEVERKQARRELKGFAAAIFGVAARLARDGKVLIPTTDSHESGSQDKIPSTPSNSP
jgi:hypothetical protein